MTCQYYLLDIVKVYFDLCVNCVCMRADKNFLCVVPTMRKVAAFG